MNIVKKISLIAVSGKEESLKGLLRYMVTESRKEPGCAGYDLFQLKEKPEEFWLLETWETEEALAAHRETAHFKEFKEQAPELIADKGSVSLIEC